MGLCHCGRSTHHHYNMLTVTRAPTKSSCPCGCHRVPSCWLWPGSPAETVHSRGFCLKLRVSWREESEPSAVQGAPPLSWGSCVDPVFGQGKRLLVEETSPPLSQEPPLMLLPGVSWSQCWGLGSVCPVPGLSLTLLLSSRLHGCSVVAADLFPGEACERAGRLGALHSPVMLLPGSLVFNRSAEPPCSLPLWEPSAGWSIPSRRLALPWVHEDGASRPVVQQPCFLPQSFLIDGFLGIPDSHGSVIPALEHRPPTEGTLPTEDQRADNGSLESPRRSSLTPPDNNHTWNWRQGCEEELPREQGGSRQLCQEPPGLGRRGAAQGPDMHSVPLERRLQPPGLWDRSLVSRRLGAPPACALLSPHW
ncbi:uncharacterized protein LOC104664690 isoform X3 [Rhinopithecus roxellana]|uniref:uncharacterized protein LOC104664690 isoform X3 n=1 Tax=Rhinopithecus roxellana TaxID=61622 RepID=UPI0012370BFA|nr:uncharacterized protein LOC104664690 isoform X3 [Rhinopithecus roxellana]